MGSLALREQKMRTPEYWGSSALQERKPSRCQARCWWHNAFHIRSKWSIITRAFILLVSIWNRCTAEKWWKEWIRCRLIAHVPDMDCVVQTSPCQYRVIKRPIKILHISSVASQSHGHFPILNISGPPLP